MGGGKIEARRGGGGGRRAESAVGWSSSDNPHRLADQSVENRQRCDTRQMEKPQRHPVGQEEGTKREKKKRQIRMLFYINSHGSHCISFVTHLR